jgi:site-specific DNA-cytosine methylase
LDQQHVQIKEHAWIERAEAATYVLSAAYLAAKSCTDFYDNSWETWKFQYDLIVTGGPSCCPFSISGKRLRHEDPRSSQGLDTAMMAVALGALAIIIENVVNLVDEEHLHHVVQGMSSYLAGAGYVFVGLWRLTDSAMGGCSNRERVFLRWEREDMASCLPPLGPEPAVRPAGQLLEVLLPVDEVEHLRIAGQCKFTPLTESKVRWSLVSPVIVGHLWIRGPAEAWMPGEGLRLRGDHRLWRILVIEDGYLKLIYDDRRRPKFRWVRESAIDFNQRA